MKRNISGKFLTFSACMGLLSVLIYPGAAVAEPTEEVNGAAVRLERVKQSYEASLRLKALKADRPAETPSAEPTVPAEWLTRVEGKDVNMVTNRVADSPQTDMSIEGRTYYVPGPTYAWTLAKTLSLRYAQDPLTERTLDKSEALTFADASGNVYYFESEETCKAFLSIEGKAQAYISSR